MSRDALRVSRFVPWSTYRLFRLMIHLVDCLAAITPAFEFPPLVPFRDFETRPSIRAGGRHRPFQCLGPAGPRVRGSGGSGGPVSMLEPMPILVLSAPRVQSLAFNNVPVSHLTYGSAHHDVDENVGSNPKPGAGGRKQ